MIPLYPYSGFTFHKHIDTKLIFLDSARSSLLLIAQHYKDAIFLIPSYTCLTVLIALQQASVRYNFIDIDDTLGFDENDLKNMMKKYEKDKIVIISTSLFNSYIKDYKKLYPELIIVEDRAQGMIEPNSLADFQIVSFGKGKMVSGFDGGAVYDKYQVLKNELKSLEIKNNFFKSYFLSIAQKIISRMWFLIENTKYDPETSVSLDIPTIKPSLMSKIKTKWILNTIRNINYIHRIKISNYYLDNIKQEYLFNINKNMPYLRLPIKKNISFTGVSKIRDFHEIYHIAKSTRNKEQKGALALVDGSFLPTHNLVTLKYAKKLVEFINCNNR